MYLPSLIQRYRWQVCTSLAIATLLIVALPVAAQEVMQTTFDNMLESQEWWNTLWEETFTYSEENEISIYALQSVLRFILAFGLLFWVYQYAKKMMLADGIAQHMVVTIELVLPILFALIFLSDQGTYSRTLAYGMRDLTNSWSNQLMEMQIVEYKFRVAIQDQLILQDVKAAINEQAQRCLQMPQPEIALTSFERPEPDPNNPLTIQEEQAYDYLDCLRALGTFVDEKNEEVSGIFPSAARFLERAGETVSQVFEKAREERNYGVLNFDTLRLGLLDFAVGLGASTGYEKALNFSQWLWISFLEMAKWLLGLFASLYVAMSVIPGRQNMILVWFIEFLTIGIAQLAYVLVIGVVAVQLSSQTTYLASDLRFAMALGLFAPGVSLAIVLSGSLAAVNSFRSQSIAVAGAASGFATSFVTTVGYSLTRVADKRR